MVSPAFVFHSDNWEATVIRIDEAHYFEEIDMADQSDYLAFDIDGNRLRLVFGERSVRFEPTGERDQRSLHQLASSYWRHTVDSPEHLLEVANEDLLGRWQRRWPKRPRWLADRMHGATPPAPFTMR